MVDYSKSKIYKIEPINIEDEGDIYIGSTTKDTLAQRMTAHRGNYKYWKNNMKSAFTSVYNLFEKYGVDNCKIFLLENYPCNSKDELRTREGYFIRSMKCVNKLIAGRGSKQYYDDNKDMLLTQHKLYYDTNKNIIINKNKAYYDENKDKILEYYKEYCKVNKDKLYKHFECECGGCYNYNRKANHFKTKKHKKYLNLV
jgi:hypothetical protein